MAHCCKAYRIEDLKQFCGFSENFNGSICYLREDFTVSNCAQEDGEIIFDAVTPAWLEFCKIRLNFDTSNFSLKDSLVEPASIEKQALVTKSLPMLPMQLHCLTRQDEDPHIFNMSYLSEVYYAIELDILAKSVLAVLERHDALRQRILHTKVGLTAYIADSSGPIPLAWVDLSSVREDKLTLLLETESAQFQSTLNLSDGPLMRVVYFKLPPGQPGRLLLIFHHFVFDAYSYSIFIKDFTAIYACLKRGLPLPQRPKATSLKSYAEHLFTYAQSDELLKELDYWTTLLDKPINPLPVDYPNGVSALQVKGTLNRLLDEEITGLLISLTRNHISISDILLAAYFQAYTRWTNERRMLVEIVNQNRISPFGGVYILHSIGYFAFNIPFLLDISETTDLREIIFSVKNQLHNIPKRGIGYGLLRYLRQDVAAKRLSQLPQPQLYFDYLGRSFRNNQEDGILRPAKEAIGNTASQRRIDPMFIYLKISIVEDNIHISWEYQKNVYRDDTIETLHRYFMDALYSMSRVKW